MSKSKLNRRQLKKTSKIAMGAVIKNSSACELSDFGFCKGDGQFYLFSSDFFGECNETSAEDELKICFANAWDQMTTACLIENWGNPNYYAKEYYSLSFANRIHYMIKFLGGFK